MQSGRAKGSHWLTFKKIGLAFTERLGLKATRFATNVTTYLQLFFLDRAPNADARSISDHLFLPRDFLLSGQECLG